MINGIIAELIFDLRLDFDSKFKIHNSTIARELKRLLNDQTINDQIDNLIADQLDDVPLKISYCLELIKAKPLTPSDENYKSKY